MSVNHGGFYIFVAKMLLHCANIVTIFQQMCRETMPQRVTAYTLAYTDRSRRITNRPADVFFMQVMARDITRARVG
jgi:hypothetical protein